VTAFRDQILAAGLLLPMGADGLYGRSEQFEAIVMAIDDAFTRMSAGDGAERLRFPPAMPRAALERSRYMRSFPQLAGTIHCFCGDDRAHRELMHRIEEGQDWADLETPSELALAAAACYPVYPAMAARGPVPAEGWRIDVQAWCFRHEPSLHATRMQYFRMREQVRIGAPEHVEAFRDHWLSRAADFANSLGLDARLDDANDPFFGRTGKFLADSQRSQRLKLELLIPIEDGVPDVACASFNNHQDHFSGIWGLTLEDGQIAATGCLGFGLERLTLALLARHGLDCYRWPSAVRAVLWP
jgi:seryl-tRNA synthetase